METKTSFPFTTTQLPAPRDSLWGIQAWWTSLWSLSLSLWTLQFVMCSCFCMKRYVIKQQPTSQIHRAKIQRSSNLYVCKCTRPSSHVRRSGTETMRLWFSHTVTFLNHISDSMEYSPGLLHHAIECQSSNKHQENWIRWDGVWHGFELS